MEKRLRRARTVAIVLAILFYLLAKLAYFVFGNDLGISDFVLPVTIGVVVVIIDALEYGFSEVRAIYLTMTLSGLGLTALSATVAYAINAMLRIDAD